MRTTKIPFRAGQPSGVQVSSDGRPVIYTDSNEAQYLETAPTLASVHNDPGFENSALTDWDGFWVIGSPVVSSDTSVVYSGDRSCKIVLPAGGSEQILMSSVFDVAGGDRIPFSTFAVKSAGSPTVTLGLLSRNGGTPNILDYPATVANESARMAVGSSWQMFQRQAVVTSGHTKARLYFRVSPAAAEACTVYLDFTASAVVPAEETITPWDNLPLNVGFGDVTNWAPAEYRRRGDDLEFRGLSAWTGGAPVAAGSVLTATALPEEFRPTYYKVIADSYIPAPPAVATVGTTVYIRPDGHVVSTAAIPVNATLIFDGKRIDLTE